MRIVIDTNVLISGLFWQGPPKDVLAIWKNQNQDLIVTQEIFLEYHRVIQEVSKGITDPSINEWIRYIAGYSQFVDPVIKHKLCRDPDDNKFLDCALAGNVRYLITGDSDLLDLKGSFEIPIVKPAEFVRKFIQ